MESAVLRTLNMLQTAWGRNHTIIDDGYNVCLTAVCVASTVDADSEQCVQ